MPEALVIFAVFAVAVAVFVGGWVQARDPANFNAQRELIRSREQHRLLQERLHRAQRENWSAEMIATVSSQLEDTAAEIERLREMSAPPSGAKA
ncbi:MAG: hypothetical protein ABIZ04_13640 [Opitutus sp.]